MARALRCAGLTLLVALVCAAPASAAHVQCGDVITQDTTLDSDLVCPGDGLTVEAAGITLDLAGHTIQGPGASNLGVIVWSYDQVTIRRGTIRGFSEGVSADGANSTALRRMVLESNGAGLRCAYAPDCLIEQSVVRGNGTGIDVDAADSGDPAPTVGVRHNSIRANGVGVSITGAQGLIAGNAIARNTSDGIRTDYLAAVDIRGNVVKSNGGDGVHVYNLAHATVVKNHIVRNAANGAHVEGSGGEGGDTHADLTGNVIRQNGADGILVEHRGMQALVRRNDTSGNGDDGIDIDHGDTPNPDCCFDVVVHGNRAFFNRDLGIEAAPGTTDGGGNRARRNGNPAQCVGVTCR